MTICLIFLAFGIFWILTTGILLPPAGRDAAPFPAFGGGVDWAFLILATVLLYLLLRYSTGRLRESEEVYRTLVEHAGSIILTMDRDGKITFFNRYAEELFGFPRREILGASVIGTIVPATESSGRDLDLMMQELLSTPGRFLKNRNENVTADGRRITVLWTNRAMYDRDGYVNSVLSVGTDLPEEGPAP
ncbi:MAG: PAS domain-containing protein [Methanomicrobiales archaeon]|nr:PAS domain-containing protein [Methanomicrobiales archaeon]